VSSRYSISAATVVSLVLLRLVIGWHFFSEGAKHFADPHWTSEPVLRSAKGPFAPWYHSYLNDFHGFQEYLHADDAQTPEHAVQGWIDQIQKDWDEDHAKFVDRQGLDEGRRKQSATLLHEYQARLRSWAAANQAALATHFHEWRRAQGTREAPAADLPFQKKRLADKQALLSGEAASWQAELKSLERDYENGLAKLAGDDAGPSAPRRHSSLDVVDRTMTYGILAIGLLLLLGLFTRLACVAGALFLLSVVMMQPFWVSDAAPTFKESVELFALLALATTDVGRWAGLDFFVARLISRPDRLKGTTDVSES